MEITKFAVDEKMATRGQRVYPFDDVCWFDLMYANCDKADARRMDLTKRFRAALQAGGDMAASAAKEITCKVLADIIILGWNDEAITLKGEPFPYNKENAYILVKSSDMIRDRISEESSNLNTYRVSEDEEAQEN